jgi:type IV pilus assembly protein PilO
MEQLIERVNKLSLPIRAGIVVGVVLLLTAIVVYFFTWPVQEQIEKKIVELKAAEQQLIDKQAIADNLVQQRQEMDRLEQSFQEALTQLPEKKDMDELLAQLGDIGKKSGLDVMKIVPGTESAENTFISRVPIAVSVSGNYHEVAIFMQEVANLRRIVNVSNIKLASKVASAEKVVLASDFIATTYRFSESKAPSKPGQPAAGGK